MYVLDEPSIGLHQRDNLRLIAHAAPAARPRQQRARRRARRGDHRGGRPRRRLRPGRRAARRQGSSPRARPTRCRRNPASLTGRFLAGTERIEVPATRRTPTGWIELRGRARAQPQERRRRVPARRAGRGHRRVGRGQVVADQRHPAPGAAPQAARQLRPGRARTTPLVGLEQIDKVIDIDQKPIGRTPRSNPATYTKAFDADPRRLRADAGGARLRLRARGGSRSTCKGGRCEACEGDGVREVEMHFLPDVYVTCEVCKGKRYNEATLRVKWKDKKHRRGARDAASTEALRAVRAPPHAARHPADARRRRASATSRSASRRRRCRAARPSGSSCRASWPSATPAARSTCSTSRPPACTSTTCASC